MRALNKTQTLYFSILCALILLGCPKPTYKPSDGVTYTQDHVYGLGYTSQEADSDVYQLTPLYFDLLQPSDSAPSDKPAIVMIHGGSFESGTKTDLDLLYLADILTLNGYICFLIDYRLSGDNPPPIDSFEKMNIPSPSTVHAAFVDAKVALRYVRTHTEDYGIDPNRIAVFGESAGAFAALAAGVSDDDDFVNDGPDFSVPPENNPEVSARPAVILDCWGSAELVLDEFDANDPPIFIWHGFEDTTVPMLSALNIREQCEDHAIPYAYYLLWGEGHGAWDARYDDKDLATHILEFLAQYMPEQQ